MMMRLELSRLVII